MHYSNNEIESCGLGKECMEENILTMYMHMEKKYALLFGETWSFDLMINSNSKASLGESIVCDNVCIDTYISKYSKKYVKYTFIENVIDAYWFIKEKLRNHEEVAFVVNRQQCWWHKEKRKTIMTHVISAINVDNQGGFVCFDCKPYYQVVNISLSEFISIYIGPIVSIENKARCEKNDVLLPLKNLHEKQQSYLWKDSFSAIEELAKRINYIDFSFECKGTTEDDVWNSPIFYKFETVALSRKKYAKYLEEIAREYGNQQIFECSQEMDNIAKKWEKSRLLLIKAMLSSRNIEKLKSISRNISEISQMEKMVFDKLCIGKKDYE